MLEGVHFVDNPLNFEMQISTRKLLTTFKKYTIANIYIYIYMNFSICVIYLKSLITCKGIYKYMPYETKL
jgi:hypothetical protein